jgi:AraC-like DNA-binding protein
LELLRASFDSFSFTPHIHQEYMVVVTESGAARVNTAGGVQRVGPGDVIVLNPDVVHGGGPTGNLTWRYRSFYPPVDLMQRVAREFSGDVPRFAPAVIRDPALAMQLLEAHRSLEGANSALVRESLLLEGLANLIARHAQRGVLPGHAGAEHRAVRIVKDYLDALPAQNVSLDELAREANISPFRLCRVFRRDTGLTPHAYQVVVRTRFAKSLLVKGVSISQAALEAGFFDQAHLTRHFKRIYGVTPGRYSA